MKRLYNYNRICLVCTNLIQPTRILCLFTTFWHLTKRKSQKKGNHIVIFDAFIKDTLSFVSLW